MPYRILLSAWWTIVDNYWQIVSAIVLATLTYFADLRDAFNMMFIVFIVDLFVGIRCSKVVYKIPFSMDNLFTAIKRMILTYALIMMLFTNDKILNQNTIDTAGIMSWLVTGFLIYSIAQNGYKMTGAIVFLGINKWIRKRVLDMSSVDIEKIIKEKQEKDKKS